MKIRAVATQIICDVIHRGYSLATMSLEHYPARDQALIQAICYGVCRWYFRLDEIAKLLLEKPLKQKDQDIYILILVGLYQLIEMRIPDHAAVSETVAATRAFKKIWAKGLINGVLRQYQRRAEEINEKIKNNSLAMYSHPEWLLEKITQQYPEDASAILTANNQHPPFALRVNQRIQTREKYLTKLSAQTAHVIVPTASGIILENPVDVMQLPGFSEGEVSVQDGAAQLAAELLHVLPGQRVLDACAAPGGKTAHILESQPEIAELIAIDRDALRLASIHENLQRLRLQAKCICADAGDLASWWDGVKFDRILLDVPCSASGVIRRHPDIKLLRRESDIATLAAEQQRLLNTIWQTLQSGGMLLYATCSIFAEENTQVVKTFLTTHPDAREEKIRADWGRACEIGRQILPGMHNMDGFYYACLIKQTSSSRGLTAGSSGVKY